jgi:hypothetical protein
MSLIAQKLVNLGLALNETTPIHSEVCKVEILRRQIIILSLQGLPWKLHIFHFGFCIVSRTVHWRVYRHVVEKK